MKKAIPWLALAALLLAAGAWYIFSRQPADTHPSVIAIPEPSAVVEEPSGEFPIEDLQPPAVTVPEPEPLPSLEDSDQAMIEELAGLVGPESLDAYFVMEQIVSRLVATVDSLPSREIAPLVLPLKPARGPFQVVGGGDVVTTHPDNAARYTPYARMAESVDTTHAVALYVRFYPLFQEAYKTLGYPDAYFNDRLVEVIDHLLDTPEIEGPVRLVKPEAVYLFEDAALESLSAGQKILLRMGRDNAAVIRGKLREIREAVGGGDL